ncbi:MAG: transglycosylase SLT domain-containing protein [Oligoflexales bacterium]
MLRWLYLCLITVPLINCATQYSSQIPSSRPLSTRLILEPPSTAAVDEVTVEEETDALLDVFNLRFDDQRDNEAIPLDDDQPRVQKWLKYYTTRGRKTFERWLARGLALRNIVVPLLQEEGLPEELMYLAMVESGFNTSALSSARACGVWQFMPATGRMYGLNINYWVDERRDPAKATIAAARYLKDLHARFGDWYLAFAAYNAGPGSMRRAIRRSKSRDYWRISKTRYLKAETRNYVPKILAAMIIGRNPEEYGFETASIQVTDFPKASIQVTRPIKLEELAGRMKISLAELKHWNPELLRGITPPLHRNKAKHYPFRIPLHHTEEFHSVEPTLSQLEIRDVRMHKIRRGDTLIAIARRYGVSLRKLKEYNRGLSAKRLRIGKKLAVPIPAVAVIPRKKNSKMS